MEAVEETAGLYEVERRARPGFRITELQLSPTQEVPWCHHNNIQDTFYVLRGAVRILLSDPPEEVHLMPGETYSVAPKRAHLVKNAGCCSTVFFVLQGIGEYDFCPAPKGPHSEQPTSDPAP